MPGDTFTKDEFKAALEVQAKATEQMVLIATSLKDITVELKEVHARLSNGAVKDIVQGVTDNYNSIHKETITSLSRIEAREEDSHKMLMSDVLVKKISDTVSASTLSRIEETTKEITDTLTTKLPGTLIEKIDNSQMAKDMDKAKWFIMIVGVVIIVATVVLRGIDSRNVWNDEQNKEIKVIEKILAAQLKSVEPAKEPVEK